MFKILKTWFSVLIAMLVLSCTTKQTETVSLPVASETPTQQTQPILAHLEDFKPVVNYRRSHELMWQGALSSLPLYRYDAVQTQVNADAKIIFVNGSELDLEQNTLVIINSAPTSNLASEPDRAVVRGGKLKTSTKRELWLRTSAALLKMKASADGKPAQASLSITEGKKLEVTLDQGVGTLISSDATKKAQTIVLTPKRLVTLSAPVASEKFGKDEDENLWLEELEPPKAQPSKSVQTKAPKIKKLAQTTAPIDLLITSPLNGAIVHEAKIAVSGKVAQANYRVIVNGQSVKLSPKLEFLTTLSLTPGANNILIQLIKSDGISIFQRRTVTLKE